MDEATGRGIAPAQSSKSQWTKDAPEIAGYEFAEFSQQTEHIYSQEDLTYIVGYPDKTVGGERDLSRSEAAAKAGWIKGYPDGTFKPDTYISRAEAVSLINRMRNRVITADELKALGVENPYTDLVETYWAYGDLIEATVKHSAADWHKLNFADTVNRIVERFVDENGNEIAEAVSTEGQENYAHKGIRNFRYMGYVTTITYVYKRGVARLIAEKSIDKDTAQVGDKLVYTVTAHNEPEATDSLENVVLMDELPGYVDFIHGSVQVDGVTAPHSFEDKGRKLSVNLGDIEPGQQKVVTFGVTVNSTAYGQKFSNTAVLDADNHTQVKASDMRFERLRPAVP